MKEVEARAKTRPEAIQKALDELGAELHEVEIEILDEGSKGLFGMGAREVHVKVRAEHIPDEKPRQERERKPQRDREPKREREPKQSRDRKPERKERSEKKSGQTSEQPAAKKDDASSEEKQEGRAGGRRRSRTRGGRGRGRNRNREQAAQTNNGANADSRKPERSGDDNRGGGRNRGGRGRGRDKAARGEGRDNGQDRGRRDDGPRRKPQERNEEKRLREPRPRRERTEPIDPEKAKTLSNSGAAMLQEVVEKMGMECSVSGSVTEEGDVLLQVESPDSAILIGRKGSTLHALQFLMNRMLLQGDDSDAPERIVVDIERYRERRRESLEEMALDLAARAKETGRTMRVKPLNPQERRVVHLALEDDENVRTYSLGNSVLRRIVIVPEGADENDRGVDDEADEAFEGAERDGDS